MFLRIAHSPETRGPDSTVTTLLEIDAAGYIPREVGLAPDGHPTYVTRPGEYGVFNDSPMPRTPPGTAAFDDQWLALGRPIDQREFEELYARADATLPRSTGASPRLGSDALWTVILVVFAVVVVSALLLGGVGRPTPS